MASCTHWKTKEADLLPGVPNFPGNWSCNIDWFKAPNLSLLSMNSSLLGLMTWLQKDHIVELQDWNTVTWVSTQAIRQVQRCTPDSGSLQAEYVCHCFTSLLKEKPPEMFRASRSILKLFDIVVGFFNLQWLICQTYHLPPSGWHAACLVLLSQIMLCHAKAQTMTIAYTCMFWRTSVSVNTESSTLQYLHIKAVCCSPSGRVFAAINIRHVSHLQSFSGTSTIIQK